MNKNKEMLEIIEGFQNLSSKIKEENDSMRDTLKNKNTIIAACKKEYQKLFEEHSELKKKYIELEAKLEQNKVEKVKKRKRNNNNNNNKRKKVMVDYESDADDEKNTSEEEEEEENDNDYEIVKVKKNKKPKKTKVKKNKKVKGIIDYINSRNI